MPMSWTYTLHGAPAGAPQPDDDWVRDQEPGHILMIERATEAGVCDGYVVHHLDYDARTAEYDWVVTGTPTEVVAALMGHVQTGGLR